LHNHCNFNRSSLKSHYVQAVTSCRIGRSLSPPEDGENQVAKKVGAKIPVGLENMELIPRAIATAASNNYFPWLLNLIASIQQNYPDHPPIYVYDLGMRTVFIDELKAIQGVVVREVPPFVPHWRACYTWKFWVWNDAPAENICYLDAGVEVLKPLAGIFAAIQSDGYFCHNESSWGYSLADIVPGDLLLRLGLNSSFCKGRSYFNSGVFGFRRGTTYHACIRDGVELAKEGWVLGWSKSEQHRNRGKDTCAIVRDCVLFRHDQTLINLLFYKKNPALELQEEALFAYDKKAEMAEKQIIWHPRRNNKELRYMDRLQYVIKPGKIVFLRRRLGTTWDALSQFGLDLLSWNYMSYFLLKRKKKICEGLARKFKMIFFSF